MSAKVKNITLDTILNDKTSGSSGILSNLNSYFVKEAGKPDKIRKDIRLLKAELKHFAAIVNYLKKLELVLGKNDGEKLKRYLAGFAKKEEESFQRMFNNCREYLRGKNKILTLSNSKTLLEVFSRLYNETRNLEITILESLPGGEGTVLSKKLLKEGIKTKVIPDSAAGQFIQNSDVVIIGADQVLKNGNVVNKTGSRNAAIICKNFNIPFIVLASRNKFSTRKTFSPVFPGRVHRGQKINGDITPQSLNFEVIEKSLISKIFAD